jgi:NADPH-dependent 2,4-dienoyl-CoA reductase/sulfur reductase-like enzyme/rhodanese-related sulfurtransferase
MSLRIVIIGGVAGGMSAATRARRMNESASITILERGGFISFANCGLPYHLSGRIASQDSLLLTDPERARRRYNLDARVFHEATCIDRDNRAVSGVNLRTGQTFALPYDKLILAPGASPIIPPIEHVKSANVFQLRQMEDALAVRAFLEKHRPRRAVVVGAGFIGLEMAEVLREAGIEVMLIEKAQQVLPPLDPQLAPYVLKHLAEHGVRVITGNGIAALEARDGRVVAVGLEDGRSIPADMVLLSIGVRPNVGLAREAGLAIGASGAIAVDPYQRTSDPDIYAVGDAAEVVHAITGRPMRIPLAGPANRSGRLAGEHAATGSSAPAPAVLGTAVVGIFDLTAAMTGLGEASARAAGFDVDTAVVHPAHHASYYPGAQQMHLKLIFDRSTGRVLGASAVGPAGVDKRIDVIATLMHYQGTIDDLAGLDLTYAPQYGSARDPVHIAAFVARNQRAGLTPGVDADELDDRPLVDVRTQPEFDRGSLPGAINIPVDELRGRLDELEPARPVTVYCQVGLRGHIATRILAQHGIPAQNLKGGYLLATARQGCP